MAKPRYRYAHQQERNNHWRPIVAAGEAYCAEPICLLPSRWIPPEWAPTQLWHVCHDPTGTVVIGVGHRKCNTSEGATRGNRMRGRREPSTANRWTL